MGAFVAMMRVLLAVSFLVAAIDAGCKGGIPAAEVKAILKSHNNLRVTISKGKFIARGKTMPAAKTAIPALKWDCELEKTAQNVSNQCVFKHSSNRVNTGENLYTMTGSMPLKITGMGKAASDAWKKEFQDFGWASVILTKEVFETGVGHATQMAWAATKKIGCGIAKCNGDKQIIVTCHYKDAGNYLNAPVYVAK